MNEEFKSMISKFAVNDILPHFTSLLSAMPQHEAVKNEFS